MDVGAAGEIEVGREAASGSEDHFAQHRAAFEGHMIREPFFVKKLEQVGQNHIDLDIGDVAGAGARGNLTELAGRQHQDAKS
jgi:hypothetical protein